jgi:hypothetical protein
MPDSGASGILIIGESQFLALQKLDLRVRFDYIKAGDYRICFGKGLAFSKGMVNIKILLGRIIFHVISANTPFLYYI